MSDNSKPSLGRNGKYCVCYRENLQYAQLNRNKQQRFYTTFDYEILLYEIKPNNEPLNPNRIYLTQSDFKYGTYRIIESGTYILSNYIPIVSVY